jgi:hypothetical protein
MGAPSGYFQGDSIEPLAKLIGLEVRPIDEKSQGTIAITVKRNTGVR